MVKDDILSGGEAMYPLNAAFENNLPLIVVKKFLKGFHSQICMDPFNKVSVFFWRSYCSVLHLVQYSKDTLTT